MGEREMALVRVSPGGDADMAGAVNSERRVRLVDGPVMSSYRLLS